ncbi:MAG TPA: SDR family oxidoreductase [Alphaproteobacteria bacterium]|jgi:nucleoside-diphosphate-sugar epimerase|nr:SDR family oxidoreductase [Alphaproteobacteria bacterium]
MENLVIARGNDASATGPRGRRGKRVLVTGADGYIGSILVPLLVERGYEVDGLDTGYYRAGWLYHALGDRGRMLTRDIRLVTAADLSPYEAIFHLAELSNDPLCQFDERTTYDINHRASVALAENAKRAGVRRFIYASSCSVYGVVESGEANESTPVNPQTAYAHCKLLVERDVSALADRHFAPIFLRNATAFGPSPRMRFDIVLNNLAGTAWTTGCIDMTSDGTPWRPLVHVLDICAAMIAAYEAPLYAVANEVFNVGAAGQNYRVREIVDTVSQVFPVKYVTVGRKGGDNRSYRVNFDKIRRHMPAFECRHDVWAGARQLHGLFQRIGLTEAMFTAPPFIRLRQLQRLLDTRQIDSLFYWYDHDLSGNAAVRSVFDPAGKAVG